MKEDTKSMGELYLLVQALEIKVKKLEENAKANGVYMEGAPSFVKEFIKQKEGDK